MPKNSQKKISLIVPVYNEALGINAFHASLIHVLKSLPYSYEIIYINDGSTDSSLSELNKLNTGQIRIIDFSKNFGKEMATTAGLHAAAGDAAVILDADGQHPVELIPRFLEKWRDGYDVVIGVRKSNKNEGFIKRIGSKFFYKILNGLGVKDNIAGSTDFRVIDRIVIEEFKLLTEHSRITRALIDWLGYDKLLYPFAANARQHGEASYSVKKLTSLAFNGFVSLSFTPLYLAGYLGLGITTLSLLTGLFVVIETYIFGDPMNLNISGTAILALLTVFLVGIILICQGIFSIYLARIYTETQNRPLYVIKKSRNE